MLAAVRAEGFTKADRQTDRTADILTCRERQTGRQTDRHANRETELQR